MADNDSDFAQPLAALSVQNPVTVTTSSSVTVAAFAGTVAGIVAAAGTITAGTGFTVARTGTGAYTVSFSTAFSATPVVIVTCAGGVDGAAATGPVSASSVGVSTFITNTGVFADEPFHFIAFVAT